MLRRRKERIPSPLKTEFEIIDISLHQAVEENNHRAIKILISETDIDGRDKEGNTPLIKAIMARHNEAARILMDEGADLNISNSHGDVPLLIALKTGNLEIARIIANEYFYEYKLGDLELAIKYAKINYADETEFVQLLLNAKIFECVSVSDFKDSLDEGVNINAINHEGKSVLISAIEGRVSVGSIYFLIASGVMLDEETVTTMTENIKKLMEAKSGKAKKLSEAAAGADPSDEVKIKFNSAVRNIEELMQYMVAIVDDNMLKLNKASQHLLENGIPINVITSLITNPHGSEIDHSLLMEVSSILHKTDTDLRSYKDLADSISGFINESDADLEDVELDEEEPSPPTRTRPKDTKDLRKLLLTKKHLTSNAK